MVDYSDQPPSDQCISNQDLTRYGHFLDQLHTQINELENQVTEVEQFYQSTDVQNNDCKTKGREKPPAGSKKPPQRVLEEMQDEIMRNFSKMLNDITHHKWAWPFLEPVDVKGLGLYDYYEIIEKPMDFSTIEKKMKVKDGSGYKNVKEIYADVRLIFNNAMKYNEEKHTIHEMAKTLLYKFEKKWSHLLPKVTKLENELSKEAHENLNKKLAQEATYANMTMKLSEELSKADKALTNLKSIMIAKCRKLSSLEKPLLAADITKLSPDNLHKALEIVNENNPNFQLNIEEVTLDLDSQSNYTLWRLYMFVKNALELQDASSGITHVDNIEENEVITREEEKTDVKRRRMI
ncbi:hypothetical protein KIW84_061241 [Lathyrus oleraceus]|uniref:Uncharacterized protein n=1 Tax=Pisum sativum TaxID=3888 RepID=A0A9D5A4Y1_PEA|nr:hypothetical protein KIW84_061241 [Pisum sativum]